MAAKEYNAGTIFLQVVPVFRDLQNELRREAKQANKAISDDLEEAGREGGKRAGKAAGEEMTKASEKAGRDAGKAYAGHFETSVKDAVKTAEKEISRLDFKSASDASLRNLDRVKKSLAELKDVDFNVDFDAKSVLAEIALLKSAVTGLTKGDHELNITANMQHVLKQLDRIEDEAEKVVKRHREMHFDVDLDTKPAERRAGAFEKKFQGQMKKAASALGDNLGVELTKIRAKLDSLGDARIGVDLDGAQAVAQAQAIAAEIQAIVERDANIDVDIDAAAAMAELAAFSAAVSAIDGREIDVSVDVDTGAATAKLGLFAGMMAGLRSQSSGAGIGGEGAANSFRSFNVVILAALVLIPALIPVIGALGGALLALVPILGAVVAAVGVAVLGFSGIGNAVTELGKVADERKVSAEKEAVAERQLASSLDAVRDAERALADARRNAARANADAQRALADAIRSARRANEQAEEAVTDAREQAADAIEAAYERQEQAADAYADAQKRVREAEQDLADARKAAQDEAASLEDRQRQNAVDERQAVLDLMDAQAEYNAVMADGSSTNVDKEQASINLENAQISLNGIRAEQADLTQEQADWAANGVDGNEQVQDAQANLTQALKDQKEAQEAVKEAAEEARDVQIEAAELIADALKNQQRTARDGQRAVADAQRQVARTAADGARAIADAQRNLARAQRDRAQAVETALNEATAAEDRLKLAMDALGPAGRRFARFIFGLRDEARSLRDAVQEAMLPGIQAGLERIIKAYGPQFKAFAVDMAGSVGQIFREGAKGLESPAWKRFFKTYAPLLPKLFRQFARGFGNWMTAAADAFVIIAPFAETFSEALLQISRRVRKAFEPGGAGSDGLQKFMEYAAKVGPDVAEFFGQFARAAGAIAEALAPLGLGILKGMTEMFRFIADMDPDQLETIATAIVGVAVGFQLAVGAVALLAGGAVILANPVALIVFLIAAIATAIFLLAKKFPIVREIVGKVFDALQWYVKKWWTVVSTYFGLMWWIAKNVLWPAIKAIAGFFEWLWKDVFKPVLGFIVDAWKTGFNLMKWYWDHILWPVIDLIMHAAWELWKQWFGPAMEGIRKAFKASSDGIEWVWKNLLKPIFTALADFISTEVAPKFELGMALLAALWEGLKAKFAEPIRWVIDKVINNGIIDAFNWVANKVGSEPIKKIPLPEWGTDAQNSNGTHGSGNGPGSKYAQGGVLPGYTPGRDVHSFVSPTAGRLELSGGEAIMRPEWTAAMGKGGVDYWNNLSKRGVGAVRNAMRGGQAFAKGGIFWPVPGRNVSTYPGHDGVDINRGSGWDDFGDPIVATRDGVVTYTGTAKGYGNSIWIKGTDGYTTLYGHTSQTHVGYGSIVRGGQLIGNVGNTGNSSAPHLHFGVYPGGTYEAALAYLSGAAGNAPLPTGGGVQMPGWVKDIVSGPVGWVKDRMMAPLNAIQDKFGSNPLSGLLRAVPNKLISEVGGAIKDMVSGGGGSSQTASESAGMEAYRDGGILPYNGTMKYDSGGYLPPGLTSVVNLTGRPEPVFTADQFDRMGGPGGDGFTYAPTFNNSDLTAADVVDDLDFARRKIQREGKYGRSHT